MEVFFLRHGPAEPKANWSGDDIERPLSAEGRLIVAEVAASLVEHKPRVELVLTSPYDRTRQTAHIVAERLGMLDKVTVDKRLIPGFGLRQLSKVLHDHADRRSILMVGHGPDFTQVVRALTGGHLTIRKAGVAQVEIPDPHVLKGRLLSLIVPAPIQPEDESASNADS
jgi:phosphohistidine phosphatase